MVCRMWHGWTAAADADSYDSYLKEELFPRVRRELEHLGYKGFHVLRLDRGNEAEFVTMVWFESMDAVKSFAGEKYNVPVISPKALKLLSRYDSECAHYELSGFYWPVS